jgi:uncharacterized protein (TIGR02646 family)
MVPIRPPVLPSHIAKMLTASQNEVNAMSSFGDQVTQASIKWKAKVDFGLMRTILAKSISPKEVCQYCGYGEETDIEHIYPKSHFPEKCFLWENYLLACAKCNTHCKRDQFAVFVPFSSDIVYTLPRRNKSSTPIAPPTSDAVFINPRGEDPMDFLQLDLTSGVFFVPTELSTRDQIRCRYSIDLIGLNRDWLIKQRPKAFNAYQNKLKLYGTIKAATSLAEIEEILLMNSYPMEANPPMSFMKTQNCELARIKKDILDDPFPIVWEEMKRQASLYPQIQTLFIQSPEALRW